MSASILSGRQPFSLPSDGGVHWNANQPTSIASSSAANTGLKKHIAGTIERNQYTPPQSFDAVSGGRSIPDYAKAYGN